MTNKINPQHSIHRQPIQNRKLSSRLHREGSYKINHNKINNVVSLQLKHISDLNDPQPKAQLMTTQEFLIKNQENSWIEVGNYSAFKKKMNSMVIQQFQGQTRDFSQQQSPGEQKPKGTRDIGQRSKQQELKVVMRVVSETMNKQKNQQKDEQNKKMDMVESYISKNQENYENDNDEKNGNNEDRVRNDKKIMHTEDCEEIIGFYCDICLRKNKMVYKVSLNCGHNYCQSCLIGWATEILKQPRPLRCPNNKCGYYIDLKKSSIFQKLPNQTARNYNKFVNFMSIKGEQNRIICPNQLCQDGIISLPTNYDKDQRILDVSTLNIKAYPQIICERCQVSFCSRCLSPAHQLAIKCNNWREQLQAINQLFNLSRCQQCQNFIQKTEGCQHMSCKCGYQFCFKCGERWRQFHLCNPFRYSEQRKNNQTADGQEPQCTDYAEFVCSTVSKILWALAFVMYILPLVLAGYIIFQMLAIIILLVLGISYGFVLYILDQYHQNGCSIGVLIAIVLFPLGMIKGIMLVFEVHLHKLHMITLKFLRLSDMLMPFGWIPFRCLS